VFWKNILNLINNVDSELYKIGEYKLAYYSYLSSCFQDGNYKFRLPIKKPYKVFMGLVIKLEILIYHKIIRRTKQM